jgi:hypothetical protein
MSGPAKVHSSDAIDAVRLSLISFIESVRDALTELSSEMRKSLEWLEHDRPAYWRNQVRLAMDQVHEAQQALHRCLMFPVANERPSCYEERAELKKAQARLVYCQEKQDRVRHWQQTLRHELFEYEGRISQLVKLVDIDAPQAIGVLNKIMRRLEEYQAVRTADPKSSYDDVTMARAIWEEDEPGAEEQKLNNAVDSENTEAQGRINE